MWRCVLGLVVDLILEDFSNFNDPTMVATPLIATSHTLQNYFSTTALTDLYSPRFAAFHLSPTPGFHLFTA